MPEIDVVHLAIAPPAALDGELVKKVAAIVGKTPYETRFRLSGKIPKIIANYDTMQMAELAAQGLRELGLVVLLCTDSELRRPWLIFKARSLKFEEQAITFYDKAGQARQMDAGETFIILSARMQAYTETQVTETTRKLNITATLLLGGIPITKKAEKKVTSRSYQTESFLRLYGRTSPEPALQIRQHEFDYTFLGTEMVTSATANFGMTIKKIREAYSQAIFDDSLIEPFGADMPVAIVQDTIEANCKLIYWYRQAISKATSVETHPGVEL